jgi:hypothetical protein
MVLRCGERVKFVVPGEKRFLLLHYQHTRFSFGVTVVSQWCYSSITVLLRCCESVSKVFEKIHFQHESLLSCHFCVTVVLQLYYSGGCYRGITVVSRCCEK